MDIHKHKSWHGPGEFFREYLIIVVGVLTALGGEQAVEWMHRQGELAETREALGEEIAHNVALIILGAAMDHCRSGMIEKYETWARGESPQPENPPYGVPVLSFSAWDVAKGGPLSRMPVKERLSYSSVYDHFIVHTKNSEREVDMGLALAQYVNQQQLSLDPDQAKHVLELSTAVQTTIGAKTRYLPTFVNDLKALGISSQPVSENGRDRLKVACKAAGMPVPSLSLDQPPPLERAAELN